MIVFLDLALRILKSSEICMKSIGWCFLEKIIVFDILPPVAVFSFHRSRTSSEISPTLRQSFILTSISHASAVAQGNAVRAIIPFKGKSSFLTPR
jgi:hypothetical protein